MAKQAPRFIVQPGWKLCFAAELSHLISWAEIALQQPLTRNHAATADTVGVLGRAPQ
jgi:hypothetical protein